MFCTFQCIAIYTFQRVAPTNPLVLLWLAPSHKTLRFKLNTLNLALGGISVLHKTNYPIASRGAAPPRPPASEIHYCDLISPPLLDPPLAPRNILKIR